MSFQIAGEIIGQQHQIREITLAENPHLPDGKYHFIELYCTDKKCDCRKTIIQVLHNNKHVSTINYGWEKPSYYVKWARIDDQMSRDMSGVSIDFMSPDIINPDQTLLLFEQLLDKEYIQRIKSNYSKVRTIVDKQKNTNHSHLQTQPSRNSKCPCGSGKKYKRCCIDKEISAQNITPFPNQEL